VCSNCARALPAGIQAYWLRPESAVLCMDCAMPANPVVPSRAIKLPFRQRGPGTAGHSATEHFMTLYRPWRQSFRRRFSVVVLVGLGLVLVFAIFYPRLAVLYAVLVAGVFVGMYAAMVDAPPGWIENWRRGAAGEKKTEKVLRRLRGEWSVLHDVIPGRWNIDHIVIGPSGVYLLDSKVLTGEISIRDHAVVAKRGPFEVDHWSNPHIERRLRGTAAQLHDEIRDRSRAGVWVVPVVVLWADFPERIVEDGDFAYVHGDELATWLVSQSRVLSPEVRSRAATALQEYAAETLALNDDEVVFSDLGGRPA
jgi:hypothetical protein